MKVSPRLFCLWSFLDKKLESALQRNYITRHLCLFVYFSLISHNFQPGANDESLHFCFKSTEQVGNFASRSIRPLCGDMSQKCTFCFITEVSEDYKSRLSQSTAHTSRF